MGGRSLGTPNLYYIIYGRPLRLVDRGSLIINQVRSWSRSTPCGKSSLDLPLSHRIWPRLCLLGAKYFDSLSIAMKLYCCQCIDYNIHPHLCFFGPSCQPYWHLTIYFKVSLTVLQFLTSQVWTSIWTTPPPLDWRQRITQYGTLTSLESPFVQILRWEIETLS